MRRSCSTAMRLVAYQSKAHNSFAPASGRGVIGVVLAVLPQPRHPRGGAPLSTERTPSSSSSAAPSYQPKPWLDEKRSIESRVQELMEAPKLHPADLQEPSMLDLVKQCCRLGNLEGMKLAQDVVDRLLVEKRRMQAADMIIHVPVQLHQTVLFGWASMALNHRVAPSRMREVLQLAVEEAKQDAAMLGSSADSFIENQPTVSLFNTYLQGLANAARQTPQAAFDGEAMLPEMTEFNRTLGWHVKPNTRSYTHVITAFANARHKSSGQRAYNLLQKMKRVHVSEREAYENDYGTPYSLQNMDSNKRHIVTPDAVVYTATIKALMTNNNSPEKVVDLLNEAINTDGLRLDNSLFTVAIRSLGSTIDTERNPKIRKEWATQADNILLMMVDFAKSKGFSQSSDDETKDSTRQVDHWGSLLTSYNACMDTWARSFCAEAAPRCESILQQLIHSENIKPDTVSFNTCLYAWSRAHKFHGDAAQRAEKILTLQRELSKPDALGDAVKPDFQSFTICIMTHADSQSPDKIESARRLLDDLLECIARGELRVKRNPNAPFSAVLTAIARTLSTPPALQTESAGEDDFNSTVDTRTDPYSVATTIFQNLQNDVHGLGTSADHHAISAFLRCIVAHCAPGSTERDHTARTVFLEACQAGQVSRPVLEAFKETLDKSSTTYSDVHASNPPKFWSRNVSAAFR